MNWIVFALTRAPTYSVIVYMPFGTLNSKLLPNQADNSRAHTQPFIVGRRERTPSNGKNTLSWKTRLCATKNHLILEIKFIDSLKHTKSIVSLCVSRSPFALSQTQKPSVSYRLSFCVQHFHPLLWLHKAFSKSMKINRNGLMLLVVYIYTFFYSIWWNEERAREWEMSIQT